jgi:cyclohexanone monooxygenase
LLPSPRKNGSDGLSILQWPTAVIGDKIAPSAKRRLGRAGVAEKSEPTREPIVRTVDAVVVGAGFAGIYMLHELREAGFSAQGFETGDGVGGTWYWNRYPGARCDVPSLFYSYTWSDELTREWRWSQKYSGQPEILRYANHVADRYDLKPLIAFETKVTAARYEAESRLWTVETDRGDKVTARWCVMATGCLSQPRRPPIEGVESFRGQIYQTSLWPHEGVDLTGLAVGVIGTGSSGIQSIPVMAEQAKSVTVFQRTPNYSIPSRNGPLTDEDIAEFQAAYPELLELLKRTVPGVSAPPVPSPQISREERFQRYERMWAVGGASFITSVPNLLTDIEINDEAADFVRQRIADKVRDPKVAEILSPRDHPVGTKRICVDTEYYEAFNRPNVHLVNLRDTPIEAITPAGVRTSEQEYPLDVIVFATGFDAMTGALTAIDIRGAGGERLGDVWQDGPRAYLGLSIAGFPNLFTITGPGSPSVLANMLNGIEQHVDWIVGCMSYMRGKGFAAIAADPAAQDAWVEHVAEVGNRSLFPRANSWYVGANIPGKPRVFMPYISSTYRQKCDEVAERGYEGFVLTP